MKRSEKQSLNCIRTTLNISTVGKESKCLNCGLLKESDYFYVDTWKRESVDGKGPKPVKDAITFLHTGPDPFLKPTFWSGSNVSKVYIRHKRNRLEASIHSPNGWFESQTRVFLIKKGTQWKINKLESVREQTIGLEGNSFKIQIHENNQLDSIGYFDNPKYLVE